MIPDFSSQGPAADRLGLYVQRLTEDTDLPMFSRRLLDLLALPSHERTSAQKLAELVLEDYALTFKVLRIANSFHYNRSNRPIESISHAIVVLGMQTVQKLASTLAYFQNFEQRSQGLQQLMICSMLSAHVAAIAADLDKFPQREAAYLAGMFQNLGEILVARHFPARHAAIQACVEAGMSAVEASVQEVGFTYDQLASTVTERWKLSPYLSSLWQKDSAPADLATLASFGNEVTRLMRRETSAHRDAGAALLLMRYGSRLRLTADGIADIWERALDDTRATFATLGVTIDLRSPTHRGG